MSTSDFTDVYIQLVYALEFDAIRASGDDKKKLNLPL